MSRSWLALTLGLLAIVVGAVWTLQGLDYLTGSAMSGQRFWVVAGPVVVLVGLVAVGLGLRARRRRTPSG
ncbi:hypothetical protein AB0J86_16565 [Micromonospora sp. NPDC049559]|uniref:hypothetical protein n=1 Tax=Micromonospora sp. NPDC049559 TaxID=3155923 RepID=UPI003446D1C2